MARELVARAHALLRFEQGYSLDVSEIPGLQVDQMLDGAGRTSFEAVRLWCMNGPGRRKDNATSKRAVQARADTLRATYTLGGWAAVVALLGGSNG